MHATRSRFWRPGRTRLWQNTSFLHLWAAQTVSHLGTQITLVALPLAAALTLDASAGQMGLLAAAGTLPSLVFGLLAGVAIDRLRRRPVMIAADLARALVLVSVPLAWALGLLRIELLFAVAFLNGILTLLFDVAYVAYMPAIVPRDDLVEGNAKLEGSASTAQVAGPGLGGILVGVLSAPAALLIDAVSYLVSAVMIARIRSDEPPPRRAPRGRVRRDIGEGLRVVWGDGRLRAILLSSATVSLFGYVFMAVYVLYMLNDLGFGATQVGLVFSLGGLGALFGAALAGPLTRRLGIGRTVILGRTLFGVFGLLVPLAVSVPRLEVPMVLAAEFLQWLALVIAVVNEISLRQTLVPERLLGRATATFRFIGGGMIPVGSLLGGLLGELIGLRETLVLGCFGMLLAGVWVYASPLRGGRALLEPIEPLDALDPRDAVVA